MAITILGISAYYHDSAAALVRDGQIVAAAQEERFTRKKFDAAFPAHAARWCLNEADLAVTDLDYVVFYDKPFLKFERLLETYLAFVPRGLRSFATAMPIWLKEKLYLKTVLRDELAALAPANGQKPKLPPLLFNEHHRSHAASAFFASPFDQAAVLCLDGVGEWATSSVWLGEGNRLTPLWEIQFPHSLGLLYSAFTAYCGFKVNSGEYKLMGLAPYGEPTYAERIRSRLIDIKDDGTFRLDMAYFNYATGLTMTNARFHEEFGGPPRTPETPLTQRHMDLARSIQVVTEDVVLRLGRTVHAETGAKNLCLAGGVALNCVANGRLAREGPFEAMWIQPSAGDAGGALGAALSVWNEFLGNARTRANGDMPARANDDNARTRTNGYDAPLDAMNGGYLGPRFRDEEIEAQLSGQGAVWTWLDDDVLFSRLAALLDQGHVLGWMQGRMEFGPRALGARSILGDARSPKMQSLMNLKIKYRESFRPFAPAVLAERLGDYFEFDRPSPYMLLTVPVGQAIRLAMSEEQQALSGLERLNVPRSQIPAVTHVDYSARIQTVHAETNPRFWRLLKAFEARTGCGVLINTSFNVRGEPIVCSPEDAYRCFMRTEMDYLAIGNYLLARADQPQHPDDGRWRDEFELD
ncbi:MAG: carbamoyltransferase [Rhodospirillales bacterium]|nr:carbamoyltransferase [Rhodospirillales bacterium]